MTGPIAPIIDGLITTTTAAPISAMELPTTISVIIQPSPALADVLTFPMLTIKQAQEYVWPGVRVPTQ